MYILKKIDNNFELFDNDKFISNNLDFSGLKEEEQKEIGWFDVEKLASEFEKTWGNTHNGEIDFYISGFQKAQSLLSDRNFTLDDIIQAIIMAQEYTQGHDHNHSTEEIIQFLSQPKSWPIECIEENGKIKITKIL